MRPFEYLLPRDLTEASTLLARLSGEAKLLAGGQSLVPLLRQRTISPRCLIDIKRLPGLDAIREEPEGLRIGALVTHRQLAVSQAVAKRFPMLVEAEQRLAHPQVRNWGTVGGNLSFADPRSDLGAPLLALGAQLKARSVRGERTLPLAGFFRAI